MSSIAFYEALPILPRFEDTIEPENYHVLPDDWYVVITDVKNSTVAIEEGRYKEVNAMGAVSIMGILNMTKKFNIPFIFGGDGATMCIPPELYEQTIGALKAVKAMAAESFTLDLRCGIVPVSTIESLGQRVLIARYGVSGYYQQASFGGGGLALAEKLIKSPATADTYDATRIEGDSDVDVTGLECRWDEVPNKRGEVHSLLIEVLEQEPKAKADIYRQIFRKITEVYGTEDDFQPITVEALRLTLNNKKLSVERRVRTFGKENREKVKYWIKLRVQWLFGKYLMRFKKKTENTDWGRYKSDLAANTDYRKLDDMLRLVLAGTETQRFLIQGFLEDLYEKNKIVYGLHHASNALITCVILNHHMGHIHLIDGSNGGYTMAASKLKLRKKRIVVGGI